MSGSGVRSLGIVSSSSWWSFTLRRMRCRNFLNCTVNVLRTCVALWVALWEQELQPWGLGQETRPRSH